MESQRTPQLPAVMRHLGRRQMVRLVLPRPQSAASDGTCPAVQSQQQRSERQQHGVHGRGGDTSQQPGLFACRLLTCMHAPSWLTVCAHTTVRAHAHLNRAQRCRCRLHRRATGCASRFHCICINVLNLYRQDVYAGSKRGNSLCIAKMAHALCCRNSSASV